MATLVLGALGTAAGGPVGGAIGALAGRQFDGLMLGPAQRGGPRLRELELSLSSYGIAIPRVYGRMRVAGAVIWASELREHSETRGGGKGQPALMTHSYTANLAVALSSRPIQRIGRIWADGRLLRGAAGDLKVGGTLRLHTGAEDQFADPVIAASEGEGNCPAFRGIAYVVFESLDLAEFGNRIPALSFEIFADDRVHLSDVLQPMAPGLQVQGDLASLSGLLVDGSLGDTLAALDPVMPIAMDAAGASITVRIGDHQGDVPLLDEPASSVDDDAFGKTIGYSRRRDPSEGQLPAALRYHDVDRDYQPGTQLANGRAGPGNRALVELPAALSGGEALRLVEQLAWRRDRSRDRIAWRTCAMDTTVAPGSCVRLLTHSGLWRVESWEWRDTGVELELVRADPARQTWNSAAPTGFFGAPVDLPVASTRLVAFERPWDGAGGEADRPHPVAAVGATGPVWSGAALYADRGDGQLWPLGSSGRRPAVIGTALNALPPANPMLLDRASHVTVALAAAHHGLLAADLAGLAAGANLALVGDELIQFGRAEPLGEGQWRLSLLLRGCGGTEGAIGLHTADEPFVLLGSGLTPIDPAMLGSSEAVIAAIGHGDAQPVLAPLRLAGIGTRPLAPVHARAQWTAEGALRLQWTRRARGGWRWDDAVDVPLCEERERYLVTFHRAGTILRAWSVDQPVLQLSPDDMASVSALAPAGAFQVCQQGKHAASRPLPLLSLR